MTIDIYETTEKLEHKLTEEEKKSMTLHMVKTMNEIEEIETDMREYQSQCRSRIQKLQNVVKRLATCIRTGVEPREVAVQVRKDFTTGIKTYTRLDTNEVYKTEPVGDSDEERQPSLPVDMGNTHEEEEVQG
jgi:hypothetical protein